MLLCPSCKGFCNPSSNCEPRRVAQQLAHALKSPTAYNTWQQAGLLSLNRGMKCNIRSWTIHASVHVATSYAQPHRSAVERQLTLVAQLREALPPFDVATLVRLLEILMLTKLRLSSRNLIGFLCIFAASALWAQPKSGQSTAYEIRYEGNYSAAIRGRLSPRTGQIILTAKFDGPALTLHAWG